MKYFIAFAACASLLHDAAALPQAKCAMPLNYQEIADAKNRNLSPPDPVCEGDSAPGKPIVLPKDPPKPAPSPPAKVDDKKATTPDPKGYGDNFLKTENSCVLFNDKRTGRFLHEEATNTQCKRVCGATVQKQVEAGHTASISCISFISTGNKDPKKQPVTQGGTLCP